MKSKVKGNSKKKAAPAKQAVRKSRQSRLPGMEDEKLDELHGLAEDYVGVRDRRIALNQEEKPLKSALIATMHKNGKMHYHHNGLEITVTPEGEKLKVKLHKGDESEEESEVAAD